MDSSPRRRNLSMATRAVLALALAIAGLSLSGPPAQAATVPLGTVVQHLPDGGTLTTFTRVATAADLAAVDYPCCSTYLHAGGITPTDKGTCLQIGITTVCVTVFYRSYEACEPYMAGLVYSCEAGQFVFNPSTTACGTTCTQGGLRGSHSCDRPGDRAAGYTMDISGCGDYRIDPTSAPILWKDVRQWKQMKICVYTGIMCGTFVFHVDLFRNGGITLASGG